eukprot:3557942-Lingulodinium_polyedra.AAC.1
MARLSRCCVGVAARKPHPRACHARARKLAYVWSARARGFRAVARAKHRFDRILAQRFANVAQGCG